MKLHNHLCHWGGICVVAVLSLSSVGGCGKQAATKIDPSQIKVGAGPADDTFSTASKLLKQASETAHYRNGLMLVNAYLNKVGIDEVKEGPPIRALKEGEREFFKEQFALDDEQIQFVAETKFMPADAFHIEASFLFRDAARSLDLFALSKPEQVAHTLDWVARHVLLHEQGDDNLPPQFVLKRGYGSVRDRALIFLQLLRQMDLGGCLVEASMPKGPDLLLVGVLTKEGSLQLFDVRLGKAVLGPDGKEPATLAEALKEPALLKSHGYEALTADTVRLRLATSLGSLSPRMHYLERRLASYIRITLFQDTLRLAAQLEDLTGLKPTAWSAVDAETKVIPPTHLLLNFLPSKEEGGEDETNRLLQFKAKQFPIAEIQNHLIEMRMIVPEIPQAATLRLITLASELFTRFVDQPRDMLLRGKPDEAIKRVNRILTALEEFDQREPRGPQFQAEVAKWRTSVNSAFAEGLKRKGAELRVWEEDRYLGSLLDQERETMPRMASEKSESMTLTFILLRACRRALGEETQFLLCQCLSDNADRQQALRNAAGGKASKSSFKAARDAWTSAQGEWRSYNTRYRVGPENVLGYYEPLTKLWAAGEHPESLLLIERLLEDLHKSVFGRYQECQARLRMGHVKIAKEQWEQLRADVQKLGNDKGLIDMVSRFQKESKGPLARRFALIARDWEPHGPWATWQDLLRADPTLPREKKAVAGGR